MYTNISNYGGNFRAILDSEFTRANGVSVASGYASLDVIRAFNDSFVEIAKNGGVSKLLLGMAFYEGLSQKKLDTANLLNEELIKFNNGSGVYVTNGRRYHGKVYYFDHGESNSIYVGSSNFSASGTKSNIECTIPVLDFDQQNKIVSFLDELYSTDYSVLISDAEITVPSKKKVVLKGVENLWHNLKRFDPNSIDRSQLPKFEFPLDRIAEKEKSNLNIYFGKGRWNRTTGKITPRPWYEIELIASNDLNSQEYYPKGDFSAYTDDGYIIPMRTQGDFYKNIRSRNSLQILGIWLKGKLERNGVLKKYQPVTLDTLAEYGNSTLTFYKIEEGRYFMEF